MKNVDEVDGIALVLVRLVRPSKGIASCLVIFHRGSVLHLETISKTEARSTWEDPLEKEDFQQLKKFKELDEFKEFGLEKLGSVLGRDLSLIVQRSTRLNHGTVIFTIPQDKEVFSHKGDENHDGYCWLCGVTTRKLEKSVCAGCLKARYCSLQCQGADWDRHRDYCMKTKQKRQEKAMCKVREIRNIVIDWSKEVD